MLSYLLRKLKEALDPLKISTTPMQLGLKLFGHLGCPDTTASSRLVEMIGDVFSPDDAQRLAIQRALASELLMILGPPGTGKTDVLAAIAMLHAMLYKRRILITSHTNIAIDNAIIRLVGFLKKHGLSHWLDDQLVVRYGNPHLAELETDDYRNVTVPLIVADYIEQQGEEIARLERRRDQIVDQLAKDEAELPQQRKVWNTRKKAIPRQRQRAVADIEALEAQEQERRAPILEQITFFQREDAQVKRVMSQTSANFEADEQTLKPLIKSYQDQRTTRDAKSEKVEQLRQQHPVKRFFVQLVTNEWTKGLDADLQALKLSMSTLAEQIRPLQSRQATTKQMYEQAAQRHNELKSTLAFWTEQRDDRPLADLQELAALQQEIKDLDQELQDGTPRIAELEQAILKGTQERALIEDALAHLDQQVIDAKREAARKVIESAQIVGATLTGLYMNPTLLNQEWDVVIVDEGSMAPPPAVLVAANRARAHLIVVGDPLQLAPVCKIRDPNVPRWQPDRDIVQRWLGRDIFHHGGYTLEQADTGTHHSVLLPYQGRMDSAICDLIRGPVYKNRLKDRDPNKPRPTFGPEPEYPVVLYDTSAVARARAEQPASKSSRFNRYHAEMSVHLAQLVLAGMPERDRKPECIGIVTPYAAHREVLKDLVRGTDLEILSRIGTVHAFQGLEFNALIFDLVESPGLAIAPFLKYGWGSEAMRLMNVAVTRARHKLLIVANMGYIRKTTPAYDMLRQITELACQKRCIPAENLS